MKILIDMNLSPRWVGVLAEAGIEAFHWVGVGRIDAPDVEIMNYANTHGFVVLTHDLDFGAILAATNRGKPSVVQIRAEDVNIDVIGKKVVMALQQMEFELEEGALVTVDPTRTRLRILPLRCL